MLSVTTIPAWSDNYMYLLVDTKTNKAAAVDPVEPEKIVSECKKAGAELVAVLTTHHHGDHSGGNDEMARLVSGIKVYGSDRRIPAMTDQIKDRDKFSVGELQVECLKTPCHTSGHICYLVKSEEGAGVVFTGDTLFVAGCGRFFEGNAQQMYTALIEVLANLPDDTEVYCGHEYTVKNLQFAKTVDGANPEVHKKLKWAEECRRQGVFTVPSTIGEEKLFNPFMRVKEPELQQQANSKDPIQVMHYIRREKDRF